MRSWHPIPVTELDNPRLKGEHHELHVMWSVIIHGYKGYSRHQETLRWKNHLPALVARHNQIEAEMKKRGMNPHSPLYDLTMHRVILDESTTIEWPDVIEPLDIMRAKLAAKQAQDADVK